MPGWIWGLGYALCGVVTAAWYLRRVGRSDAWMRQVEAELSSLPPWMPSPGVLAVIALIVGWPIPVIKMLKAANPVLQGGEMSPSTPSRGGRSAMTRRRSAADRGAA